MDMPTIAITQPVLPSPLPTDHQALMDIFYDHYQGLSAKVRENNAKLVEGSCDIFVPMVEGALRGPSQAEIAAVMPAKVNAAVMLGNFNYQVGNGGFEQWHDNRYSSAAEALLQLYDGAAALGIENAADTAEMIRTFMKRVHDEETSRGHGYYGANDDEEESEGDAGRRDDDLCTRYYAFNGETLCQAILDRFEECVLQNFGADAFRKAA